MTAGATTRLMRTGFGTTEPGATERLRACLQHYPSGTTIRVGCLLTARSTAGETTIGISFMAFAATESTHQMEPTLQCPPGLGSRVAFARAELSCVGGTRILYLVAESSCYRQLASSRLYLLAGGLRAGCALPGRSNAGDTTNTANHRWAIRLVSLSTSQLRGMVPAGSGRMAESSAGEIRPGTGRLWVLAEGRAPLRELSPKLITPVVMHVR